RAEIFQRANTARSIADIDKYLSMVETLRGQGVPVSESKHQRVRSMREHLVAVQRGVEQLPDDDALWDPLPAAEGPSAPAAALAGAYLRAWETFRGTAEGRALAVAIALAAVVRWLIAPLWIVTMFIGYRLTEQSIDLVPSSHYGVGSQALYHALFAVLPEDH